MNSTLRMVACVGLLMLVGGCSIPSKNNGEAGIRWGTEVTFFHNTAKTSDEEARISLEVPSVSEWISGKAETCEPVETP